MKIQWDTLKKINILHVAEKFNLDVSRRNTFCFNGHDSKTPSLHFFLETNSWYCFGCGVGGGPIQLVQAKLRLDKYEAAKWLTRHFLAATTCGQIPYQPTRKKYKKKNYIQNLTDNPDTELYEWLISRSPLTNSGLSYLVNVRGLNKNSVEEFKISEINRPNEIYTELINEWGLERLRRAGLTKNTDKINKNLESFLWDGFYLIIPIYADNKLIYLQGRSLNSRGLRYLGLSGMKKPLFNVDILESAVSGESVYICEGIFDAIAAYQIGLKAVASLGSSFKEEWVDYFKNLRPFVVPDNDSAGYRAYQNIKKLFNSKGQIIDSIDLAGYKDLAEYLVKGKINAGY